jgi:hypothetical protein
VCGEPRVHAPVHELLLDVLVDDEVGVEVFFAQARVVGDVGGVGGVAGFGDAPAVVLEGLWGEGGWLVSFWKRGEGGGEPSRRALRLFCRLRLC